MTARPGADSLSTVARFQAELRRFIATRVPGPDADDVLQEALLRIHLGVGGLRDAERVTPWVYRVARSAIVDHLRRARLAAAVGLPMGDALPEPAVDELPEEPADEVREALALCVEPFLDALPVEQADALRRADLAGESQVDLARDLGVPLPTVKARVQRGRRRLRAELEACCAMVQDGRGAVIEITPRCGC